MHCLGPEGQRTFGTLSTNMTNTSTTGAGPWFTTFTYAATMTCLQAHFVPTINVVAVRYKFCQRAQNSNEPVEEYIIALRQLAVTCEFGTLHDKMIRDQLVEKTCPARIRERLLLEPKLTLSSALTLSHQTESASENPRPLRLLLLQISLMLRTPP